MGKKIQRTAIFPGGNPYSPNPGQKRLFGKGNDPASSDRNLNPKRPIDPLSLAKQSVNHGFNSMLDALKLGGICIRFADLPGDIFYLFFISLHFRQWLYFGI